MARKKSSDEIRGMIRDRASCYILMKKRYVCVDTQKEPVIASFLSMMGNTMPDDRKKTFYTECIDRVIDETGPYFSGVKYLVLMSDDESAALKAALYATTLKRVCSGEDDELNYFYDDDGDVDFDDTDEMVVSNGLTSNDVRLVSFSRTSEIPIANPYVFSLAGGFPGEMAIFYGIDSSDDLEQKLEVIRASGVKFAVVIVSGKMGESPGIRHFLTECESLSCSVEEAGDDYYKAFIREMFKDTGKELPDEDELSRIVRELRNIYRKSYGEEQVLYHCLKAADSKNTLLTWYDFVGAERDGSVLEELEGLVGLSNVKEVIKDAIALMMEQNRNPLLKEVHRSMLFVGRPGTGKTSVARIVARIYRELGLGNGACEIADRSSIIGKYVGHTAHMVKEKFDAARGGVLFVDEAGFFIQKGTGDYVNEAIKEFVRYMEIYPDVTVIFALYDSEAEDFMKLDAGLRSRIANIVSFEDYSAAELLAILEYMMTQRGYRLGREVRRMLKEYLDSVGTGFGNARGVRHLCEAMIVERGRRLMESEDKEKTVATGSITVSDVKGAIARMKKSRVAKKPAGFCIDDRRGSRRLMTECAS